MNNINPSIVDKYYWERIKNLRLYRFVIIFLLVIFIISLIVSWIFAGFYVHTIGSIFKSFSNSFPSAETPIMSGYISLSTNEVNVGEKIDEILTEATLTQTPIP